MKNKKSNPPVTRSEFLKEAESTHKEFESVREEIKKLATKEDFHKLANEIIKTQTDLKEVKETVATKEELRNTESRILNAIDAFAVKAQNYDQKALFHGGRINELDEGIKDHEVRITQLEKTVSK